MHLSSARATSRSLLLCSVLTAACRSAPASRSAPTTPATAAPTPAPAVARERPIPYPVPEPQAFARAVERGTRTRTGRPGPRYWQQSARYRLEAEIDPVAARLVGRGSVRYFNRSPTGLRRLVVHLNQNLFAPNAVRNRVVPVTRGMELGKVTARGRAFEPVASQDTAAVGYWIDATAMNLRLAAPLLPGDSVDLDFEWAFTIPPDGAPRSGSTGDAFFVAYWYPQMAVYDDLSGWHDDPYMANAEFYMGYADYDVRLTVPAGWLISATGVLQNAHEVLSAETRSRLARARRSGEVVHVVADADRGAGKATAAPRDGRLTWHFRATNVRDFAFGTSNQYLWDATLALVGDATGDGRADTTSIHSFYRPTVRQWQWDQSARYARHSVEFLSRYLWPYPYPHMSAVDGPVSCSGMEYPMMTCIGGPRDTLGLYSVTVHEIAHMWFPMQVGSDERRYSWQDEGLTRFNQAQGMREFFSGYDRERLSRDRYLELARAGGEVELMRHGDLYPYDSPAFGVASYDKMAINLVALRAILGEETFLRAYREYGRRWLGKHPSPHDFWNTFNDVSGRDLSWFWRTWFYETWTLDQVIASVRQAGDSVEVALEDRGLAPMPVRLAVTREGGGVERVDVPVDVWLAGARRHTVRVGAAPTITRVEIDPESAFPDIDRRNQVWEKRKSQ